MKAITMKYFLLAAVVVHCLGLATGSRGLPPPPYSQELPSTPCECTESTGPWPKLTWPAARASLNQLAGVWLAMSPASKTAMWVVLGLVLATAAVYYGLIYSGLINPLFSPTGVKVIHNPLVRRPMQIYADTVDLEEVAKVDPEIAAVAGALGYGMGIKGGIARKMLKILHGTPEPVTNDFDIDTILLAERGITPAEETELRKAVTGLQLGHLVLEPKDVEVISKEELKTYWITRDICLNEVLLLRLAPNAHLTLFYSDGALYDASHSVIRSIPHALKSDFTEIWTLDGEKPVLSAKHVARTILRFFKGHGTSYQFDESTWAYYRRMKLNPITLFQILRATHADDDKYKAVVTHLIDVGLLSSLEVRMKGGFNGLWGATLKEVNDKMAQYGGRLNLEELDAEAVENWIVQKKARMRSLPYRQREQASRTGVIPADEDTLSLGLITFPQQLLDYIEQEGGLFDPQHLGGNTGGGSAPAPTPGVQQQPPAPARAAAGAAADAPLTPRGVPLAAPAPASQGGASSAPAGSSGGGSKGGERGPWHWLATLRGSFSPTRGTKERPAGSGLTEPLLPPPEPLPPVSSGDQPFADYSLRRPPSVLWEGGGGEGDTNFIPAQVFVGLAPAVPAHQGRLGMAWLLPEEAVGPEEEGEGSREGEGTADRGPNPPSRYTSAETIMFMCRIAAAAWPLLLASSTLIVGAVALHLWQLRVQSAILNSAIAGKADIFLLDISLLIKVSLAYVGVNWLSNAVLQLYLRLAMQRLYTGLFNHVLFQDCTFYDTISTSELVTRTGVDAMNIRVLVGFLVQKLVKGLTQVIAGVTLLAYFAGPMINKGFGVIIFSAISISVVELFLVSMVIRERHRIARSKLGRLYGFAYDVFSSIQGVMAMALQRSFTDTYASLAKGYFGAAMDLAVWMANHQLFLEAVFSAGVTVSILYMGGQSLLSGTTSVGSVYAMLRYIAVVEAGYMALSEAVARFFASYGSLEHVIGLHDRGQLTNMGKPAVLEALEKEDAERRQEQEGAEGMVEDGGWPNWTRRLTAATWAGGVRCRDVMYGYKGKPGNVLFSLNLELLPGQAVLVTGGNASGRSTLAHLMHLDVSASGGSVQFQTASGAWLTFHPTSTDRYEMQQRMGYTSPRSATQAVFFASVQENLVCACTTGRQPSVADCQNAAALSGFDEDVAKLPDGYQALVGEASRIELTFMARLRLGMARLLLLDSPLLVIIDDADRFHGAVPRFWEALARLRQAGAAVLMTAITHNSAALQAGLPEDVRTFVLEGGRLRPAA